MSDSPIDRRTLLKGALGCLAVAPVLRTAHAAEPVKLAETDPQAVALGYVHDAKKVDAAKEANYKPGQICGNCLHLTGKEGDAWRPCNLFPGKVVATAGWCRVWVQKPGAA